MSELLRGIELDSDAMLRLSQEIACSPDLGANPSVVEGLPLALAALRHDPESEQGTKIEALIVGGLACRRVNMDYEYRTRKEPPYGTIRILPLGFSDTPQERLVVGIMEYGDGELGQRTHGHVGADPEGRLGIFEGTLKDYLFELRQLSRVIDGLGEAARRGAGDGLRQIFWA